MVAAASDDAARLMAALNADLQSRYPDQAIQGVDPSAFDAAGGIFLIGYLDGRAVACGAMGELAGAAEIKRMFVDPAWRGQGFSRAILRRLETEAAARGFREAVLRTGAKQPEAHTLYRSEGWHETPCFGPFAGGPHNVCFRKDLG